MEFVQYLRRRWLVVAIACLIAVVVSGAVCLAIPKRYTATASLLIEPPAGNDPRGATAISPVYLESLKTYERFASSDTVFAVALDTLHLRESFPDSSIESIKRNVLKVARPASTKIVEISATLPDPKKAQALAQNIAEQAVTLNRQLNNRSSEDVAKEARGKVDATALRLKNAESVGNEFSKTQPVETLDTEVTNLNELRFGIERDDSKAKAELADMLAQAQSFHAGDGNEEQAKWTAREIAALRARVVTLDAQIEILRKATAEKGPVVEERRQRRELIDAELKAARLDYEAAKSKLSDVQSAAAFRGERLEIMDPGIVPQSPSFPNTPLNVLVAFLLALIASVGYLAVRFGYSAAPRFRHESEYSIRGV